MDSKISHQYFVSYAQYQQQFSHVITKYKDILKDPTFDASKLPEEHQDLNKLIFDNFS